MRYCPGSGQELLSALGVIEVCQDSRNLMRKFVLSMIDAFLKFERPSMIGSSGTFGHSPHIADMSFFPLGKGSACLDNVIPNLPQGIL